MVVIKNSHGQMFCHPGTSQPFLFSSFEGANDMIERMELAGAMAVELETEEDTVERYGGDNDLW